MADTTEELKDGIYKSKDATYFIKDGKILMNLKGSYYKTNAGFMQGTYEKPLPQKLVDQFDDAYAKVKSW